MHKTFNDYINLPTWNSSALEPTRTATEWHQLFKKNPLGKQLGGEHGDQRFHFSAQKCLYQTYIPGSK